MSSVEDTAHSVVEHAQALSRLDPHMPARAWATAVREAIRTIRVLAAPFVQRDVDRAFYRALKSATRGIEGVFVHTPGGRVEVLVDTRRGQERFDLLSEDALREFDAS